MLLRDGSQILFFAIKTSTCFLYNAKPPRHQTLKKRRAKHPLHVTIVSNVIMQGGKKEKLCLQFCMPGVRFSKAPKLFGPTSGR